VIGLPRSGTTLLRNVLKQHPQIHIPSSETNFLPYWVGQWSNYTNLADPSQFARFGTEMQRLNFFQSLRAVGRPIDTDAWRRCCPSFDLQGVYEGLIRSAVDLPASQEGIWGDKSPAYVRCVPLLRHLYPHARVIHIIRDVRDQVLSARRTWGTSMLRVAQDWAFNVLAPGKAMHDAPDQYHEVKYEALLTDAKGELSAICAFLRLDFEAAMLNVPLTTTKPATTAGYTSVKADNMRKYEKSMKPAARRRIERVTASELRQLGYPIDYKGESVPVPGWQLRLLRLHDAYTNVMSRRKEFGLVSAARLCWTGFRVKQRGAAGVGRLQAPEQEDQA
jgi:hypothetical protein